MKRTYISGKISDLPEEVYTVNFREATALLKKVGLDPVNPCELLHLHDKSWTSYMLVDIEALMKCEAIYMLSNWKESKGARIEHAIALEMGMEVIYSGTWISDRPLSKKVGDVKGHCSLAEARELNNSTKTESAWVYDRFQAAIMECDGMNAEQVAKAFDEYIAKLPPEDGPILDILFRLVPVNSFDTQEQIEWLIKKGHFYYATEI